MCQICIQYNTRLTHCEGGSEAFMLDTALWKKLWQQYLIRLAHMVSVTWCILLSHDQIYDLFATFYDQFPFNHSKFQINKWVSDPVIFWWGSNRYWKSWNNRMHVKHRTQNLRPGLMLDFIREFSNNGCSRITDFYWTKLDPLFANSTE